MKLSEFRSLIRLLVPGANINRVPNVTLDIIINKGARDVNSRAKVLIKSGYFNAVADVGAYRIHEQSDITDFVLVGESGLWYNRGSVASPNYQQLDGVNRTYLNEYHKNWHVADSSNTLYAIFDPNLITVYPKPTAALDNAFFLPDYVHQTTDMGSGDDYPFTGSTTEYPGLEVLDDSIIDYVRYMLKRAVGKDQSGIITRQEYEQTISVGKLMLNRRPDYKANRDYRMKV